jgi:hypothetical protein
MCRQIHRNISRNGAKAQKLKNNFSERGVFAPWRE